MLPMDTHSDPGSGSLRRVPGLFRRWELTEILNVHRTYLLEEAGAHADGSPLLAVYVGPFTAGAVEPEPDSSHRHTGMTGDVG